MWNHLDAMKAQLLKFSQVKFSGKIGRSSWTRIPAISSMKIVVGEFNKLLEEINITKRLDPIIKFETNQLKNSNRYMEHQIARIRRYRESNPRLSMAIAFFCIKSSLSFRLSAWHHVFPRWHYEMSQNKVAEINRKVQRIINKWDDDLEFKRTYIPKANDKWRPLGVPSAEWRIVLHMWNNMIQIFMEKHVLDSQHGFIPGRGTLSAWREVIAKVKDAKFIYECDLKQFFDNVNVTYITDILDKANVPKRIQYYLENINRNTPVLRDKDLVDESIHRDKDKTYKWLKSETLPDPTSTMLKYVNEFIESNGRELLEMLAAEEGCESVEEYAQLQWALMDEIKPTKMGDLFTGVPQGAPTSPFLSILTLKEFLSQQKSVSYADDPIFYSDEDFTIKEDAYNGIILNKEKSSWVKRDGVWLKPLKFLGLILHPDGTLTSETRKGRSERISTELVEMWENMQYNETDNFLEDLATRNFFGFVQAMLYNGDLNSFSRSDREKLEERLGKVNPNSLYGKLKEGDVDSSIAIMSLTNLIKHIIRPSYKEDIYGK